MSCLPPPVIPSEVEESLRLAACAPGRICEISPRATLGRDDKGEGVLGRDDKGWGATYLSLYRFRNFSNHTQRRFMFAIASWLGMLYTSGWLPLFVNSPSTKCSESFALLFNCTISINQNSNVTVLQCCSVKPYVVPNTVTRLRGYFRNMKMEGRGRYLYII